MPAPINSNFSIYNPTAWTRTYLANLYPARPIMRNSATNVAGNDIAGFVSNRNKKVKVTRAVKPTGDPNSYSGSYSFDTPDATEHELDVNKHYYRAFKIDKSDQKFSLPELVEKHFTPRLHDLFDKINSDVKGEMGKFEAAYADLNTNPTVLDDEDLRDARKFLKKRKNLNDGLISVIDPDSEADLTGLNIFHNADQRGSTDVQLTGNMGRAFGFQYFVDNTGVDHTAATVTDATVASSASVGDTAITIDDSAGGDATVSLAEGDVIYFASANDPDDWYVVDSQTVDTLTLKEPLRSALSDNDTINAVPGSGNTEQFFYDPQALALVTAGLTDQDSMIDAPGGVAREVAFDPMNNANFTVSIDRSLSGAEVVIEVLYGYKLFYEDRGIRYIRGTADKA